MLSKKIVKYIQSLSLKKFRDAEEAFIAEGPKIVNEFLYERKLKCILLCAVKDWLNENQLMLQSADVSSVYEIDEHWLKTISQLKTPNKVLAIFRKKEISSATVAGKISIMLDDLQDPGNLGTIIRIADWFAVENIICSDNSVDCYNPKVVQSSMGSLARVNIIYSDPETWLHAHRNIPTYAATLNGISIFDLPKIPEGIFLIGNESKGIHDNLLKLCTHRITIPRFGKAESLNAGVATGIILSQILKYG